MKKRSILIELLAVLLVLVSLTGCRSEEVTLESILPRANVIKTSVSFLNAGLGDNIPQVSFEAVSSECVQLCDALYGAVPVVVEITESYSPELNASHEIALTTSGGTMTLYYDDYQNLINVPINRKVNEENVRVYLSFQSATLNSLLTEWQAALPQSVSDVGPSTEPASFPPDDSALRATIDSALFDQASTEIAFEPASYQRESDSAVYYAFGYHEKSELPENKVLLVAAPESSDVNQASILSVAQNDDYVMVTVSLAEPAQGAEPVPSAVLCERSDIDIGKPILFVDTDRNILYAQQLAIPVSSSSEGSAQPQSADAPSEPSSAAGGEENDDGPLEP